MPPSLDPLPLIFEGTRPRPTRFLLGFLAAALLGLLPLYYVYTSRDAGVPGPAPTAGETQAETANRLAGRLSYQLSEDPETPTRSIGGPRATQVAAASDDRVPDSVSGVPASSDPRMAGRIANVRPIQAAPREIPREIEREAPRSEYREPPLPATGATGGDVQPRVIEGREVMLPPSGSAKRSLSAEPGAPPGAEIETLLAATREWLAGAPPATHTLQILGAKSEEQLHADLKTLERVLEPGKLHVYRTIAAGKPAMTVIYGAYADRRTALQALDKLPASLIANRPVVRTVNGIRAEQRQHGM